MPASVTFTSDRALPIDELVALLEANGATVLGEPDLRTGDPYAGIARYFFVKLTDPAGQTRHLRGMHAFPSDQHEEGWTRIALGADPVSYELLRSVAQGEGGYLYDERFAGAPARVEREFEACYAPAFG